MRYAEIALLIEDEQAPDSEKPKLDKDQYKKNKKRFKVWGTNGWFGLNRIRGKGIVLAELGFILEDLFKYMYGNLKPVGVNQKAPCLQGRSFDYKTDIVIDYPITSSKKIAMYDYTGKPFNKTFFTRRIAEFYIKVPPMLIAATATRVVLLSWMARIATFAAPAAGPAAPFVFLGGAAAFFGATAAGWLAGRATVWWNSQTDDELIRLVRPWAQRTMDLFMGGKFFMCRGRYNESADIIPLNEGLIDSLNAVILDFKEYLESQGSEEDLKQFDKLVAKANRKGSTPIVLKRSSTGADASSEGSGGGAGGGY